MVNNRSVKKQHCRSVSRGKSFALVTALACSGFLYPSNATAIIIPDEVDVNFILGDNYDQIEFNMVGLQQGSFSSSVLTTHEPGSTIAYDGTSAENGAAVFFNVGGDGVLPDNFHLSLDGNSAFNFSASALGSARLAGIGIGDVSRVNAAQNITIDISPTVPLTGTVVGTEIVVFGAGSTTASGVFNNFSLNLSPGSHLTAVDNGSVAAAARVSVLGTSYIASSGVRDSFNNLYVGSIGKNAVWTASSNGTAVVVGAPDVVNGVTNCFNNLFLAPFGDGAVLSSVGIQGAVVFGTIYNTGGLFSAFRNWSVEFQGNASISAFCNANTSTNKEPGLTSYTVDNIRFYFNDLDQDNPTVNILGARLKNDTTLDALISSSEPVSLSRLSNVISVGNSSGIQLNVGRTRVMGGDGRETEESMANGGEASGSGGILNIIGTCSGNSRYKMRIDSGWAVNVFQMGNTNGTWGSVEINNGTLNVLKRNATTVNAALSGVDVNVADVSGELHSVQFRVDSASELGDPAFRIRDLFFGTKLVGDKLISNGLITCASSSNGVAHVRSTDIKLSPGIIQPNDVESVDCMLVQLPVDVTDVVAAEAWMEGGHISANPSEKRDNYYEVESGGLFFSEYTNFGSDYNFISWEYDDIENLKLYFVADPAGGKFVVSTLNEEAIIEPTDYALEYANAELAVSVINVNRMITSGINSILLSAKGNGNDPFLTVLGAHSHQDEIAGFGYANDIWGVMLGEHYTWDLGHEKYLRVGGLVSYSKSDVDFFGASTSNGKQAKQDMYIGGVFGSFETFNSKHLKSNASLILGLNYSRNKTHRIDGENIFYRGDFDATDIFVTLEGVKNLCHIASWQAGPYASVTYNHIHQRGYTESASNTTNVVTLSSINQDLLDFVLGWNIEKEWQNQQKPDARIRTYARLGWHCQPVQNHSTGTAYIGGMSMIPEFGYADKNSFTAQLGLRNKLNQNWEWYADYVADVSGNYRYQNLSLGIGYTF